MTLPQMRHAGRLTRAQVLREVARGKHTIKAVSHELYLSSFIVGAYLNEFRRQRWVTRTPFKQGYRYTVTRAGQRALRMLDRGSIPLYITEFVSDYLRFHGYAPTYVEVAAAFGMTMPTVTQYIKDAKRLGYLYSVQPRHDRNLRVTRVG